MHAGRQEITSKGDNRVKAVTTALSGLNAGDANLPLPPPPPLPPRTGTQKARPLACLSILKEVKGETRAPESGIRAQTEPGLVDMAPDCGAAKFPRGARLSLGGQDLTGKWQESGQAARKAACRFN